MSTRTLPALILATALGVSTFAFSPATGVTAASNPTDGAGTVAVSEVDVRIAVGQLTDQGETTTLDARVALPDASACPCPGIIWNHGFGGNKGGDGGERRLLASHGYVVLSYTSRGFGDTRGQVDLMGAKEAQDQLDAVDWLIDPNNGVTDGMVIADSIGQYGASYGGFHAWALARSGHPSVRTTVPTATGTELYEAIVPGDVEMLAWANGFYATGIKAGTNDYEEDGVSGVYDNYSQTFHRVVAEMNAGVNGNDVREEMAARAVKGRWGNVRIPVFIIQGINDALFPANQAVEAYEEIRARGVDARLYLGGIGHPPAVSGGAEVDHIQEMLLQWFDAQLKGEDTAVMHTPPVQIAETGYFDWKWDGAVRYADTARGQDVVTFNLCATSPLGGMLSTAPCASTTPLVVSNQAAQGWREEPVTSDYFREYGGAIFAATEAPTVVTFDAAPVAAATTLDLAGIPAFTLEVSSIAQVPADLRGGAAAFQLDPKVYDVAPDGTATLITRGAFAERVDAQAAGSLPQHEVSFEIFGTYYTLDAGHHLRVTLASEDAPYLRPTTHPFAATIHGGSVTFPTADWLSSRVQVGPSPEARGAGASATSHAHLDGLDTFGPFNR